MSARAVLGLDIGSSGAKAMSFAPDWTPLYRGRRTYSAERTGEGGVELDPGALLGLLEALVVETVAATSIPIGAIAVSAVGEAVVPIDATGTPAAGAMLTADARLAGEARTWCSPADDEARHGLTGLPIRDSWSGNAMRLHLRGHRGGDVRRFLALDGLVALALGVEPGMAQSQASRTGLLERASGRWSQALLEAAGVTRAMLPDVVESGAVLGRLPGPRWSLAAGTLLVCGGHDQYLAALGAGADPARPLWASGTVDAVTFLRSPAAPHPAPGVDYRVAPDVSVRPVPNLNGAQALAWFEDLAGDTGHTFLESAPRDDDPVLVPTLGTTGAPDFDPGAGAVVAGLRYATDRAALVRAALEGVVLETRRAVLRAGPPLDDIEAFAVSGGGARSARWCALKAAALDRPVLRRRLIDAGCVGAALLARRALDGTDADVERANPIVETVRPDPDARERLSRNAERYERLREHAVAAPPATDRAEWAA